MESFISEVVRDLYCRYGTDISDVRIVLPGKRSRLFFDRQIASLLSETPVWQPRYLSMNDITAQLSGLEHGGRLKLLTELFIIYRRHHPDETFARFYFWGDMLLSDFDSLDNYMVDASALFVNISDLKEIDARFDYLSADEHELVTRFWQSVYGKHSSHKQAFLKVWRSLFDIYTEYKSRLRELGLGYGGMIYRDAAEHLLGGGDFPDEFTSSRWAIVGFNALSKTERTVLNALNKKDTDVLFYWDADNYYLNDKRQEAGIFINENKQLLGDASSSFSRDNFASAKDINIISSPSDALQCRYVSKFLNDCIDRAAADGKKPGTDTVVVLTDESLLLPVLYSVPEATGILNVTGGYPIHGTAAHTLCERIIRLRANLKHEHGRTSYYHKDALALLEHPYITEQLGDDDLKWAERLALRVVDDSLAYIDADDLLLPDRPVLSLVFSAERSSGGVLEHISAVLESSLAHTCDDPMRSELLFRILSNIYEVADSIGECRAICHDEIDDTVTLSLLRRHLSTAKMSFEGEPLAGVQVMGILETRNIDFDNVLILSVGEDTFPGNVTGDSYIPASLRSVYGMPSSGYHEAMYSYYFYRLLQRAKRIDIVYNSSAGDMRTGEPSRFIRQLEIESPHASTIRHLDISLDVGTFDNEFAPTGKDARIMSRLNEYTIGRRTFSPSSLYRYIQCPRSFYLQYVEGLKVADEVDEQMGDSILGTLMHSVLETVYATTASSADFRDALASAREKSADYVAAAVSDSYKRPVDLLSETVRMKMRFIDGYVKNILGYDLQSLRHNPDSFRFMDSESEASMTLTLDDGRSVGIAGRIDRTDRLSNGCIRIIDYKSAKKGAYSIKDTSELFERLGKKSLLPPFQSMLYSVMVHKSCGCEVRPALYYARSMNEPDYNADIVIDKEPVLAISAYEDDYLTLLRELVGEILNPDIPFDRFRNEEEKACQYCDFKRLCY
ncbi:MAG: PD-(D/E)XK nuclease family protein [Rikenellaceae bacterium]|nr:PD-(D/E)XK nuclease family protein [Rikenellaceae bacterium]